MNDAEMLEVAEILKMRLTMLTGGTSSSLPKSVAERTLASIVYCIELADSDSTETSLAQNEGAASRYERGLDIVKREYSEAKKLLSRLRVCRFKTANLAYNDTLDHGLADFFKAYDMYFGAHEVCGAVDYPLMLCVPDERGARGALEYMRRFDAETRFISAFEPERVDSLLRAYSRSYADDLINIMSAIMPNIAALYALGSDMTKLVISDAARSAAEQKLAEAGRGGLAELFASAAKALIKARGISAAYEEYILAAARKCGEDAAAQLFFGNGQSAILLSAAPKEEARDEYIENASMPDEALREVIDQMKCFRHTSDKLALLFERAKSLSDIIEIACECFDDNEYGALLSALPERERTELMRRAFEKAAYDAESLSGIERYIALTVTRE